eukprot:Gregarina_sp_Poly_1__10422@NODE_750_length_6465_cov_191_781651_g557_i0_p2_GENE_NODE_750_length_6465_cov_191_781651_g557_i0NODE_750_length_6465_cov_191_781651_g557_i0_p2_ORF_typecomplete_len552_score66_68Pkinase/PF00069_25/8_7e71Pkinase_Tyr/PF07714_17/7_6e41Kinaselike/PF14531_6/2e15Kdo/PF06293_14/1_1e11Kdo/PF06293_14/2_9e03Pkinase_fungal/PF17667_1/4e08RIO1/PF01163_22/1_7e07RIO1/PF01163_22/1_3e03YrbLPhoP_reg/PF10707_9/9_6e07WaaY/PF06176_11/3_4e06APH/PF01636_23/0_0065APH/PF01636_23/1_4e03EcKinase/P
MGCQCSKNRSPDDFVRQPSEKRSTSLMIGGNSDSSDIRDFYRLGPVLGSGSFGQVRVCLHRKTDQQFACKIMTKNPGKTRRPTSQPVSFVSMFKNEINILRSLDHPNVVKLVETFEDRHFLYAIMEKCDGGELFTKIVKKRRFSEVEASSLCREMIAAIAYIHSRHIVHRDVKAENFLFSKSKSSHNRLVLIDFGMSVQLIDTNRYLRQVCGSPHYVAPELIRRYYKKEVDLWALGVVVFLMLYGRYPFEGADQKAIAQKILKSEPDYQRSSTPPSDLAITFMKGLLEKDPAKRLTPQEAMRHPWVIRYAEHSVTSMGTGLSSSGRSPSMGQLQRASQKAPTMLLGNPARLEDSSSTELEAKLMNVDNEEECDFIAAKAPAAKSTDSHYETISDSSSCLTLNEADDPLDASYILAENPGGTRSLSSAEERDELGDGDIGPLSSPNVYTLDNERTPWDSDENESSHHPPHHLKSEYLLPAKRITASSLYSGRGGAVTSSSRANSVSYRRKQRRNRQTARREAVVRALNRQHQHPLPETPQKRVTASKGRFFV